MITMALRDQPYLPLYVMDFLSDEKLANCSAESTGVYIRLMCVMHKMEDYGAITLKQKFKQNESNVKNFASMLVRQMPYDSSVIERSLEELLDEQVLTLEGDRLFQKRMVRDGELSRKRAEAGYRGGKSSKIGSSSTSESKQKESKPTSKDQSKTEGNSEIENEIEYEDENDKKKSSSVLSKVQEDRFNRFWMAYPRKSGKGSAKKSWRRIAPDEALFQKIMAALEAAKQCKDWKKEQGQYIPYPATWLNQERWEDDYGAPQVQSGPPSGFDPDNPYADWGDGE